MKHSNSQFLTNRLIPPTLSTRAIVTHSSILTIRKVRTLQKNFLKKTFSAFRNRVKSIQTSGYNGARTVRAYCHICILCPCVNVISRKCVLKILESHHKGTSPIRRSSVLDLSLTDEIFQVQFHFSTEAGLKKEKRR